MESWEAENFTNNWHVEFNEMGRCTSNNYCTFYGSSYNTSSFAPRSPSPIPLSPLWNFSPPSPLYDSLTHTPSTKLTLNSDPETYLPNNIVKLCNWQELEFQEVSANLEYELDSLKYPCIRGSFMKSLPNTITNLSNLVVLDLHDCFDVKELPAHLNVLVNLRILFVWHTKITSIPDSLTSQHKLKILDLQGCSLLEDLPANLDDLVSLSLRVTRIRSLPNSITNLPKLHILDVSSCFSLRAFPANLDVLTTLKGIKIIGLPRFRDSNSPAHESLLPMNLMLVDGIPLDRTVSQSEISNEDQISSSSDQGLAEEDSEDKLASENQSSEHIVATGFSEGIGQVDKLGSENKDRMGSSDEDDMAEECTSNDERNNIGGLNSNHDQQDGQVNKILGDECRKARKHITLQDIQQLLSRNMKLVDAANELGVSRSTLKRRWKDFDIGPWPSSKTKNAHSGKKQRHNVKSAPGNTSSSQPQWNLSTPSGPNGGENEQDYLVATKHKTSKTFCEGNIQQ